MGNFSFSGGVEILGFISPTDSLDTYPVIDPLYGIDGFRNVDTLSDLNSIPNPRRRAGMVVGVSGGTQYYKLNQSPWNGTLTDWTIFNSSGGSFTGGTVTGNTVFTNGLSATTISATTYLGLPTDIYVTGGTYSDGTATFTNNSGGTFNISGFYTGQTDNNRYTTGFTYNNNTFTISDNSGSTYSATINTMTGLTVNGVLSATTIGTSGDCVDDIYVSNIHSCSPLNINPLDEGNVYFGSTSGVTIDLTNNRVGIGTTTPSEKLDVSGKTKTLNLQVTSGATSGYVLTSDASGNATWQSFPTASASNTGVLSSTDWNTFNNKQAALVSGTNIKTVNSTSLLGSGDITTPVGIHAARIPASGGFINALMMVYQGITTTTLAANNLRCFPFIPMKSFTIVSYSIEVTTAVASSNMRVLFYDSLNGLPNAKLHESANIDSSTIGVKTVTQAYTFNAGTTYWLCVQSSAAVAMKTHTATGGVAWQQTGASSNMVNMVQYTYALGSAPATLTTTGASYTTVGVPHLIFNL